MARKRVEAESATATGTTTSMVRGKDGSAFGRWKKATSTEPKAKKAKKEKKGNNPNKPKRPPTAFFIFMDEFRKAFKEANPDSKDVKKVAKEAGEKWKCMTDEEKKPYVSKAAELKAEYDKALEANNAEIEDDQDEGGSEKEGAEQEVQEVLDEE
ncbi:hypothetical protein GH714_036999 [Hevea brasiliensis]|uniref:HMG box domain-containing protein n=1 Tax=Hevea brasiliensis TaxID=3981 RepID=A0A6A6MJU2_HEVBR|nr:hypothetical protein GH714_036999 [Hevea brasiliensis]